MPTRAIRETTRLAPPRATPKGGTELREVTRLEEPKAKAKKTAK